LKSNGLSVAFGAFGGLGVQIFFVISGFVIVRNLLGEWDATGRISLSSFYIRRAFRILPPLIFYVFAIAALASSGAVYHHAIYALRALTFTCNFPNADCGGWFGAHTWSLSVEEQFYLVVPFVLAWLGAAPLSRGLTLIVAFAISVAVAQLYALKFTDWFLAGFISIGFGVACAFNEPHLRSKCGACPAWLFVAAVAVLLFVWWILWRAPPSAFPTAVEIFFFAPLIVFVLFASMGNPFLGSAPMRYIGRISYSIYLWQQLASYAFPGAGVAFYSCSEGITLLIAAASYRWIEQPLISLGAAISVRLASSPGDLKLAGVRSS
jgi:peptidoglycan/LPS O-acetylase OafA/YrhL